MSGFMPGFCAARARHFWRLLVPLSPPAAPPCAPVESNGRSHGFAESSADRHCGFGRTGAIESASSAARTSEMSPPGFGEKPKPFERGSGQSARIGGHASTCPPFAAPVPSCDVTRNIAVAKMNGADWIACKVWARAGYGDDTFPRRLSRPISRPMAKPPKKPKDPAKPTRAKASRPAARRRRTSSPICSIRRSTRAPRAWVPAPAKIPACSRRRTIRSTAGPISPPRTRHAKSTARNCQNNRVFEEAPRRDYGGFANHRTLTPALAQSWAWAADAPPDPHAQSAREAERIARGGDPKYRLHRCRSTCRSRAAVELHGVAATADLLGTPVARRPAGNFRRAGMPHCPPRPENPKAANASSSRSEFEPKGDQPEAIRELVEGVKRKRPHAGAARRHWLGKNVYNGQGDRGDAASGAHPCADKTLAAQLYGEFKSFFPDNAVEYFVSYYDYYQPEAYVPRTDTYIEKESSINEQIDRMRHSATRALLERDDVVIVASVPASTASARWKPIRRRRSR